MTAILITPPDDPSLAIANERAIDPQNKPPIQSIVVRKKEREGEERTVPNKLNRLVLPPPFLISRIAVPVDVRRARAADRPGLSEQAAS